MNNHRDNDVHSRRIGFFLPLSIISIGVILLSQNFSSGQVSGWTILLRYWPLLLIFGGIEGFYRGRGAAVNMFWVTFGLAILLSNLSRISWTNWEILLGLWPILVISVGLDLMIGRENAWSKLAAGCLTLFIMLGVVWFFDTQSMGKSTNVLELSNIDVIGLNEAEVQINPSIGFVKIYAQGSKSKLVEGKLLLWEGERVQQDFQETDGKGIYKISSSGLAFFYMPGLDNRAEWDIGVNSNLPVGLVVDQIIGEAEIELSDLEVQSINTDMVVGMTQITLSGDGAFSGDINQVIGEIVIIVPEGTYLKVNGRPLIGGIKYPHMYERLDDSITSAPLSDQKNVVELNVALVIGQVEIRQK